MQPGSSARPQRRAAGGGSTGSSQVGELDARCGAGTRCPRKVTQLRRGGGALTGASAGRAAGASGAPAGGPIGAARRGLGGAARRTGLVSRMAPAATGAGTIGSVTAGAAGARRRASGRWEARGPRAEAAGTSDPREHTARTASGDGEELRAGAPRATRGPERASNKRVGTRSIISQRRDTRLPWRAGRRPHRAAPARQCHRAGRTAGGGNAGAFRRRHPRRTPSWTRRYSTGAATSPRTVGAPARPGKPAKPTPSKRGPAPGGKRPPGRTRDEATARGKRKPRPRGGP